MLHEDLSPCGALNLTDFDLWILGLPVNRLLSSVTVGVRPDAGTGGRSIHNRFPCIEWPPRTDLIVLGFSGFDWRYCLDANLTLGRYVEGEFRVDEGGAYVTVQADALALAGSINVTFAIDTLPGGATRIYAGATLTASFEFGDGLVEVENASITFEFVLVVNAGLQTDLAASHVTLLDASVDRVSVRFGEFITLFADSAVGSSLMIDFTPSDGAPVITFGGS